MTAKTLKYFLLTLIMASSIGMGQMASEILLTKIKTLADMEELRKEQVEDIFDIELVDQGYKNPFLDGDESFSVFSDQPRQGAITEHIELRLSKPDPTNTILISIELKTNSLPWKNIESISEWHRDPGINLDAGGRLIVLHYTAHNGNRISFLKDRDSKFVRTVSISYQPNAQ